MSVEQTLTPLVVAITSAPGDATGINKPPSSIVEAPASSISLDTAAAAAPVAGATSSTLFMSYPPNPYPPVSEQPAASTIPDAFPTPANMTFDPMQRADDTAASLKRPGEDLASSEVKRMKEEPVAAAPIDAAPVPVEAMAVDGNGVAVVYPWTNYVEPAPRYAGPEEPITIAQHKYLIKTLGNILKSNNSFNFREPVDVVRFNIPHYPNIIPYPMDLGTVNTKLHASDPRGPPKDKSRLTHWDTSLGSYKTIADITRDIRQIWENTRKFNGADHVVSQAASKLDEVWERALRTLPIDAPVSSPATPSAPGRRASISQPPVIRRTDDSMRPKREIHPPPSKDLGYEGPNSARKPKRRNDPQLQWAARTIGSFEKTQKYFDIVSPFLYPIEQVIVAIPEYKTIIKQPIDLLIIKQRLDDGVYEEVDHVDRDIRLLVSNATTFNPPGDAVYNAANALQQLWTEKKQAMPPKPAPEARAASEEAPEDLDDSDDEDKDVARLKEAKAERATLDREIADLEAKIARKPKRKTKAPKPAKPRPSKSSPNVNGNGAAKKARKPKEQASYRDDDDSDDEVQTITITQKQELAEKIQVAEAETLEAAVRIIQSTTQISGEQEIELDIDSLPTDTVIKLYNLVCRRKRGKKNKAAPRKSGFGGAPGRKHLNEQEEADRIRKMEAQLQSFEGRSSAAVPSYQEDMSSSEEESSDEE